MQFLAKLWASTAYIKGVGILQTFLTVSKRKQISAQFFHILA